MKKELKTKLLKLAGDGVTLDRIIEESVKRLIEYAEVEKISKFEIVAGYEKLLGYEKAVK